MDSLCASIFLCFERVCTSYHFFGLDVQEKGSFFLLHNNGNYTVTSSLLFQAQVVQIRVCIIYITQPVWQNLPQMQEREHYLSSCILPLQRHSPFILPSQLSHFALFAVTSAPTSVFCFNLPGSVHVI